jgi:hypothetical protein
MGILRSCWQTRNRVEYPSKAWMLKRQMMRMRSDFGLPIGTEHAHHLPKKPAQATKGC